MKALFAQGNNKLQREAPQRGRNFTTANFLPSVAVGVTACEGFWYVFHPLSKQIDKQLSAE